MTTTKAYESILKNLDIKKPLAKERTFLRDIITKQLQEERSVRERNKISKLYTKKVANLLHERINKIHPVKDHVDYLKDLAKHLAKFNNATYTKYEKLMIDLNTFLQSAVPAKGKQMHAKNAKYVSEIMNTVRNYGYVVLDDEDHCIDGEMTKMKFDDLIDLVQLAIYINNGQMKKAQNFIYNLDTATVEDIPENVYNFVVYTH